MDIQQKIEEDRRKDFEGLARFWIRRTFTSAPRLFRCADFQYLIARDRDDTDGEEMSLPWLYAMDLRDAFRTVIGEWCENKVRITFAKAPGYGDLRAFVRDKCTGFVGVVADESDYMLYCFSDTNDAMHFKLRFG